MTSSSRKASFRVDPDTFNRRFPLIVLATSSIISSMNMASASTSTSSLLLHQLSTSHFMQHRAVVNLGKHGRNHDFTVIPTSAILNSIPRGGSSGDPSRDAGSSTAPPSYGYGDASASNGQTQPMPMSNDPAISSSPAGSFAPGVVEQPGSFMGMGGNDPMYGYRETVEDRAIAWRKQQEQLQQSQSAAEASSAIDEQGRFKLFTTVSRVSVSFFFFILMWRTVHHYELADATFGTRSSAKGVKSALFRTVVLSPLVVLFLGEMMGAILGLMGGGTSHATKKRLKGVLNLHKAVELVMLLYNVSRLAILPSKYTPREVYIGRTISNFFFLMQAQLYTKLSWDDVSKTSAGENYVTESYYDDYYNSDMQGTGNDYSSWQSQSGYEDGYGLPTSQQPFYDDQDALS